MACLVPGKKTALVAVGNRRKGRRLYIQLRLCLDFGLFRSVEEAHLIAFCVTGRQRVGGMHIHDKIVYFCLPWRPEGGMRKVAEALHEVCVDVSFWERKGSWPASSVISLR